MNDFIVGLLLKLWDGFKVKSPQLASLIVLILGTIVYFADKGTLLGVINLPTWLADGVKWLAMILGFLTGSRTSQALSDRNSK